MASVVKKYFGSAFEANDGCGKELETSAHLDLLEQLCCDSSTEKMMEIHGEIQTAFNKLNGDLERNLAEATKIREQGNKLFTSGDSKQALDCYKKAIVFNPNDSRLHSNISLCLIKLGCYEEALGYAMKAHFLDRQWPKPIGLLCQIYTHLGYPYLMGQLVVLGQRLATDKKQYEDEMKRRSSEIISEKRKQNLLISCQVMSKEDLQTSVERILKFQFKDGHDYETFIGLLSHLFLHCQFGWENSGKDNVAEEYLYTERFLDLLLENQCVSEIFKQNLTDLSQDQCFIAVLILRIFGRIMQVTEKGQTFRPQLLMDFYDLFAKSMVNEQFLAPFVNKTIPFAGPIFDSFTSIMYSITVVERNIGKKGHQDKPARRLDWLLKLPVVYFAVLDPVIYKETFYWLHVSIAGVLECQKDLGKIFNAEMNEESLLRHFVALSSFAIICDRLFVSLAGSKVTNHQKSKKSKRSGRGDGRDRVDMRNLYYFIWCEIIACLDVERMEKMGQISSLWLSLASFLSKNCGKQPEVTVFAVATMNNLLSPWAYQIEPVQKTLQFPFLVKPTINKLLIDALETFLKPKNESDREVLAVLPVISVCARLCGISKQIAERFYSVVSLKGIADLQNAVLEDCEVAHLCWHMLKIAIERDEVEQLVSGDDEESSPFSAAFYLADMLMSQVNSDELLPKHLQTYRVFHACVLMRTLLSVALGSNGFAKAFRMMMLMKFHEQGSMSTIKYHNTFGNLIGWTNSFFKDSEPSSKKAKKHAIGEENDDTVGRTIFELISIRQVMFMLDGPDVIQKEKPAEVVSKMFENWKKIDSELRPIILELEKEFKGASASAS